MKELLSDPFDDNRATSGNGDIVLDFGRIFAIIKGGIWIIGFCSFMAGLIAAALVLQATPTFMARAQILLSQPTNSTNAIENIFPELNLSSEAIAGEIAVMTASRQLRNVSETLELVKEPEFNADLVPEGPEPGVVSVAIEAVTDQIKALLGADTSPTVAPGGGEGSGSAISRIARLERAELGDQEAFVGKLSQNLTVRRVGTSYLVNVTYRSTSRETAAAVPNAVVDAYLDYQLNAKFGSSVQMTEKLTERLQDLERRVEESERAVIDFRDEMLSNGFGGQDLIDQSLRDVSARLTAAETAQTELLSELNEIDKQIAERGLIAVGGLFDSAMINRLRDEISQLEQDVSLMRLRFGEETTRVQFVENEIAGLEAAIRTEVQQLRDSKAAQETIARARSDALRAELNTLETVGLERSKQQIELAKLERQRNANRVVYNSFLATVTEINEVSGLQSADAQVVSYASPPTSAVTPRKKETVAIGLFAGAFLGLGIVFVRAFMDNSIRSAAQLSGIAGGRHVLTVPRMRWSLFKVDPLIYMIRRPRSGLTEAIRTLRGQILLNAGDMSSTRAQKKSGTGRNAQGTAVAHSKRIITLVSATPKVGKTTACVALARSFTEMGRSCVVIDADLRRGSIAKTIGIKAQPDLVDVLANEVDIQSAFHKDTQSTATVVTSRDTPKDPGGLLISQGMETFVDALSENFDIVIMDTSPLLAVSDAIPIARMADEVVMLARAGTSTVQEVQEAMQILQRVNVPVTTMVLSMASDRDTSVYADYVQN